MREAGGYRDTDIGVALMRKAFAKTGPLTDTEAPVQQSRTLSLISLQEQSGPTRTHTVIVT